MFFRASSQCRGKRNMTYYYDLLTYCVIDFITVVLIMFSGDVLFWFWFSYSLLSIPISYQIFPKGK